MSQAGKYSTGSTPPPGTVVETLTGNTGGAVGPDISGNIDIPGSHGINTAGNPGTNTITIALNNAITLGDLSSIIGSNALTVTTGNITLSAGNINLPDTNAAGNEGVVKFANVPFISKLGTRNTFVGQASRNFNLNTGSATTNSAFGYGTLPNINLGQANSVFGSTSGFSITNGSSNSAFGDDSLLSNTTGSGNSAFGRNALNSLVSGDSNIALGSDAGSSYTTTESSNIVIGNFGTVSDNNTIRIGTQGSGAGQQDTCYIAGIDGVNVGSVASVVSINSGQLGTTTITAGTNITVTPGANSITISANPDLDLNYTPVNTTPYVVLSTDQFLGVDCSGAPITIQLPNAPSVGRVVIIKDSTGSANSNAITVTTVGGVVNIDGSTSYTMNTQYASIQVLFDGTGYQIF